MTLLVTLAAVSLIVFAGSALIKKYSFLFYALALVLDGIYVSYRFFAAYDPLILAALQVMQKGLIAYALFAIVMFIGVLDESAKLRERLHPIRAELSLLGCLFALGHIAGYLTSYLMTLFRDSGVIPTSVFLSLLVSLTSLVLLVILGVTTLTFVRAKMSPSIWKKIQRLSYVFFGLVYIHLMLMLVPAMRHDTTEAIVSVAAYTLLFGSYVVLRLRKARRKR
jgi:DMSO/TMAO reductase YedYZ heme-binding membrane subunit